MDEATIKDKVRSFLEKFVRGDELAEDDDIFALGYVNSLFAMQLVLFIEKEFHVRVQGKDLDLANFRSIQAITAFLQKAMPPA